MNLYSTHIEYLNEIFNVKGKLEKVIEFGMGNYSTKLLIDNSTNCISIEMQSDEWYNKMLLEFGNNENWQHYKLIGAFEFKKLSYDKFDMAFIDGHGESRPECINLMMSIKCPIIFSHDTEEPGYGWNRVSDNTDYLKLEFKKHQNWTTMWTTDISIYEHMKKYII